MTTFADAAIGGQNDLIAVGAGDHAIDVNGRFGLGGARAGLGQDPIAEEAEFGGVDEIDVLAESHRDARLIERVSIGVGHHGDLDLVGQRNRRHHLAVFEGLEEGGIGRAAATTREGLKHDNLREKRVKRRKPAASRGHAPTRVR